MSSERSEEFSSSSASPQPYAGGQDREQASERPSASNTNGSDNAKGTSAEGGDGNKGREEAAKGQATVIVRGETVGEPGAGAASKDSSNQGDKDKDKGKEKPRKTVSEAKVKLQGRLPGLEDDADVGVQKEQIVVRDGKPDLAFTGTLLASAGPATAPKGKWQEYRIYETSAGKHVFSKIGRSIYAEDQETHEAEVFDPFPASVPSQLLRSARDLTRSRPLTWMDAAMSFFGYDPLAKELYRKIGGQFEEHIS